MIDYKELYITLFRGVTKAINILQESQQKTEDLFMDSEENAPIIRLLRPEQDETADPGENDSE